MSTAHFRAQALAFRQQGLFDGLATSTTASPDSASAAMVMQVLPVFNAGDGGDGGSGTGNDGGMGGNVIVTCTTLQKGR